MSSQLKCNIFLMFFLVAKWHPMNYNLASKELKSWFWDGVSCYITDSDIFITFSFTNMIFSILQDSRHRERLLTTSVRYFTPHGILWERSLSWINVSLTAARVRDHSSTAMICFVQKYNYRLKIVTRKSSMRARGLFILVQGDWHSKFWQNL